MLIYNATANTNWDSTDIPKLIAKDKREIEGFYKRIKTFMLFLFKGDEELFNDFFLCVLDNINAFDITKGKFHNWLYTIALNKRNCKYKTNKQKRKIRIKFSDDLVCEFDVTDAENNNWTTEQKVDLERRILQLPKEEQMFLEWYLYTTQTKDVNFRMRYSRLLKKMKND